MPDEWEFVTCDASTQTDARCMSDLLTEANFNLKTALDVLLRLEALEHPGGPPG